MTASSRDPYAPFASDHERVAVLRGRILDLARTGHRVPIGTDLVLHEQPDPQAVLHDGAALGRVMVEAARRYGTPLALPVMDLRLEKSDLLDRLGVSADQADTWRFDAPPTDEQMALAERTATAPFSRRCRANLDAIAYAAGQQGAIGCGMAVGPFSLMTKLLADPITPVAMAGMGVSGEDDPDVAMAERAMTLARGAVERAIAAQIEAGAHAVVVCEPAANIMFLSPNMIAEGSDVFDRWVMEPNLAVAKQLNDAGVGLIFHDCGELTDGMVQQFAQRLHPLLLSLGSSRVMWEDAELMPDDVVLYGNLPSKRFYSDGEMSPDDVEAMTCELVSRVSATGKPFILGTECDVLSVPGSHVRIRGKVETMLRCRCG